MSEEMTPEIEECRQLSIVVSGTKALFKFESESKLKEAKVSFDNGVTYLPLLAVKKALDAFNDRYPVEL